MSDNGFKKQLEVTEWMLRNTNVKFFGDPILNKKLDPVTNADFGKDYIQEISDELINTLKRFRKKTGVGSGLSANQIGYDKRITAIWLEKPKIYINPEIIKLEGKGSYWEGCLSSAALLIGEVIRPWKGKFKYQDLEGNEHQMEADQKLTRVLLHEIDHLNGEACHDKYVKGTLKIITGGKEELLGYRFKKIS